MAIVDTQQPKKHFFISRNGADARWAEWIAWHLEKEGYTTILQDWDFRPGSNFVLDMQRAASETVGTGALGWTKRALSILEAAYGKDNPSTRTAAGNLEAIKEAMK